MANTALIAYAGYCFILAVGYQVIQLISAVGLLVYRHDICGVNGKQFTVWEVGEIDAPLGKLAIPKTSQAELPA